MSSMQNAYNPKPNNDAGDGGGGGDDELYIVFLFITEGSVATDSSE